MAFEASSTDEIDHIKMIRQLRVSFFVLVGLLAIPGIAEEFPWLGVEQRKQLDSGQFVALAQRPDETDSIDPRFVTVAKIVTGSREGIWEVINDKENAADFIEGVLESKVIEREENRILVEQLTHVGGPKGSYRYRLLHQLTPMTRADFTYAGGELRNVLGSWWIFDGKDPSTFLVVYSLHIDPGFLAPQVVVKSGMRKSMPKTIQAIADEVTRRRGQR